MAKKSKLDDDQLIALLQKKEDASSSYVHGQLGVERTNAMREYYRLPYGNEEDGWATNVTSDVQDTIEWILPALLKTFTATDKAVAFEPSKAEDIKGAEQATDACNYVFYKQNPGFLTLYTAIKDMLMVRNCAVMWRKETSETVSSVPFKNASEEMLAMLLQEEDAEIQEATPAPVINPQTGQPEIDLMTGMPVMGYSGRLKKTEKKTIVKVEAFSPEDLLIDREWTSPLLDECPYVARMIKVTLSDVHDMGYTDITAEELRGSQQMDYSADSTFRLNKISQSSSTYYQIKSSSDDSNDDSMAEGWLRMEYVLADRDGDGIAERLAVIRLREKILKCEVCAQVPIATASPILNPHRWDGMSMHDVVADLQKLHTELLRQTLNNLYLTNNPRTKVLTDANWSPLANIDDLLDSRAGGIIRQRDANAVTEQVTPFSAGASMPMLEYVGQMRENRTGVSRTSQGLNPDSLNNTATGRQIDMSAAMQRVELIARIIAETLMKPIFKGILKELTDGGMEKLAFRLRDEFVEYDPNEWRDSYDMTINVGLGTGDTQQKGQQLMALFQMQQAGMQMGITTPHHVYNTMSKIVENSGFKDVQNFIQDPSAQPPQQHPPPLPLQVEQMRQQGDAQALQFKAQQEQQKLMLEDQQQQREMQRDMEVERSKQEMQARENQMRNEVEAQRDIQKAQLQAQIDAQKLEFEKWKLEFEAQKEIYIAELKVRGNTPEGAEKEASAMTQVVQGLQAAIQQMSAPKQIVRDQNGRAVGIAHVQ